MDKQEKIVEALLPLYHGIYSMTLSNVIQIGSSLTKINTFFPQPTHFVIQVKNCKTFVVCKPHTFFR